MESLTAAAKIIAKTDPSEVTPPVPATRSFLGSPLVPFSEPWLPMLSLVAPQFAVNALDSSPGRFWEPGYGLQPLADPAAFQAPAPPDSARLLLGFVAQPLAGQTRLTTLTRVFCNSESARRRLAIYWAVIRPVSGLIRRRIRADVRRAAEASG